MLFTLAVRGDSSPFDISGASAQGTSVRGEVSNHNGCIEPLDAYPSIPQGERLDPK
jgi:hypothetical protein